MFEILKPEEREKFFELAGRLVDAHERQADALLRIAELAERQAEPAAKERRRG